MHGNLKCENILFSHQGFVKLVDFGIYPVLTPTSPDYYSYAPEQRTHNLVTDKSDVYMLGACLYKCLTLKEMRKEINPEILLGKKFTSSANLILNNRAGGEFKRAKSAVDLKLKLFANEYSNVLKKSLLGMLSEVAAHRPKLKNVLAGLKILSTAVDVYKLASTMPIVYGVNSKVRVIHVRDKDKTKPIDFLVGSKLMFVVFFQFYLVDE